MDSICGIGIPRRSRAAFFGRRWSTDGLFAPVLKVSWVRRSHVHFGGLTLKNLHLSHKHLISVLLHLHDVPTDGQMHDQLASRSGGPLFSIDSDDGIKWSETKR